MDNILFSECGVCYACGAHGYTERHHIFGAAMRKKSEQYGLTVHLCPYCHRDNKHGVHGDKDAMERLHAAGQKAAMQQYGWSKDDFIREFYKNYL
ncbi:MAG: hypothetical protein RSD27_09660 [Ruthenibacterium sp.]